MREKETSLLAYVLQFKQRLMEAGKIAQQNSKDVQDEMKQNYDSSTRVRSFDAGDKVLASIITP